MCFSEGRSGNEFRGESSYDDLALLQSIYVEGASTETAHLERSLCCVHGYRSNCSSMRRTD